jgi:acetyl esterase/lipase
MFRFSTKVLILFFFSFSIAIASVPAFSAPIKSGQEIKLWSGIAPGSAGVTVKEQFTDGSKDPKDPQRSVWGITVPTITAWVPQKPNGAAALIFAGGGYTNIVIDKEGTDIAKWLNSLGVTAFVIKFRLPGEGHLDGKNVPLQDAQRAFKIIRKNAAGWGIDPNRIGLVGLSSGGHTAAMTAVAYDKKVYAPIDDIDAVDAHPNFLVLGYPPVSSNARKYLVNPSQKPVEPKEKQELYDEYPVDVMVRADTPKTFIVQGFDDKKVDVENSVRFFLALKRKGIPADLHIFQEGVHGFAIRNAKGPVKIWTKLCEEWMDAIGVFVPAKPAEPKK